MKMTEEDKQRIEYLYHARPHTKEQGEEILKLYRQYIDPGLTSGCSKCGGSIFNYLKKLVDKAKINVNINRSK